MVVVETSSSESALNPALLLVFTQEHVGRVGRQVRREGEGDGGEGIIGGIVGVIGVHVDGHVKVHVRPVDGRVELVEEGEHVLDEDTTVDGEGAVGEHVAVEFGVGEGDELDRGERGIGREHRRLGCSSSSSSSSGGGSGGR